MNDLVVLILLCVCEVTMVADLVVRIVFKRSYDRDMNSISNEIETLKKRADMSYERLNDTIEKVDKNSEDIESLKKVMALRELVDLLSYSCEDCETEEKEEDDMAKCGSKKKNGKKKGSC